MTAASPSTVLVTGGAGFIGSALIHYLLAETRVTVVNVDKLTYAGNPASLAQIKHHPRYHFSHTDIADGRMLAALLNRFAPDGVIHLAAESHVDRSIDGPQACIDTNVAGTCALLETVRHYWQDLPVQRQSAFRFLQVSTDEVFGDAALTGARFNETSPYAPSSPYAASKAAGDHLLRAWQRTYGLPVLLCHCSNNYGPRQFPEKLIPLMIIRALGRLPLPLYGNGLQQRDWLYVDDHVRALWRVFTRADAGAHYTIGSGQALRNLDVVRQLCAVLDERQPPAAQPGAAAIRSYAELIRCVADRPGHDGRYEVDAAKIRQELGWQPQCGFTQGLERTVDWYLAHQDWWQPLLARQNGLSRLGLGDRHGA